MFKVSRSRTCVVCVTQESGEKLLYQMKEVGDLQVVEENLLATSQAVGTVCSVLQQLNVACGHLEELKLYPALKILEKIRSSHIGES